MLVAEPALFGAAVALCLATLSLVLVASRLVRDASLQAQRSLGGLTAAMQRDLVGVRTIRAANATRTEAQRLRRSVTDTWASAMRVARVQSVVTPISNVGLQLSTIAVLGLGAYRVASGSLPLDQLVQFGLLLVVMVAPLSQLMSTASQLSESLAALARVNEVLDLPTEDAVDGPMVAGVDVVRTTAPPALELVAVRFGYGEHGFGAAPEDRDGTDVLHGIDLIVPQGARVALVGPSGAGKSTVLQLVERFYEPSAGQIRLLGRDVRDYPREELRSLVAYVEQDAPIVSGTLRENLTLGLTGISDDDCLQVLHSMNLGHLVARRPGGLDALVGESGSALSGGERQRVAVARALLSPATLLLLDEATANLDAANERVVGDLLRAAHGSRTVVVVAHRLASVIDMDTIHVLEHGRLVASGRHHDLLVDVPLYRDLAREQHLVGTEQTDRARMPISSTAPEEKRPV